MQGRTRLRKRLGEGLPGSPNLILHLQTSSFIGSKARQNAPGGRRPTSSNGAKREKRTCTFCNSDKIFGSEKKVKKRLRVLEYEAERTRAQEVKR